MIIVIFGVSGAGKTTIGTLLAKDLGWKFYDADNFHSAANVSKMSSGVPLTDKDRQDWLATLRELITETLGKNENAVLACSALKRSYRNLLFVNKNVKGVLLHADFATIKERMQTRGGHFMNPSLLKSQFDTLEFSESEDIFVADATKSPAKLITKIRNSMP